MAAEKVEEKGGLQRILIEPAMTSALGKVITNKIGNAHCGSVDRSGADWPNLDFFRTKLSHTELMDLSVVKRQDHGLPV